MSISNRRAVSTSSCFTLLSLSSSNLSMSVAVLLVSPPSIVGSLSSSIATEFPNIFWYGPKDGSSGIKNNSGAPCVTPTALASVDMASGA